MCRPPIVRPISRNFLGTDYEWLGEARRRRTNQCAISTNALRIESPGTWTKPESGLSNSSIKMIPPETATEQRNNVTSAVRFDGANNPKPAKTMESQKMSKTKKGTGILCPLRCSNDHRAWIRVLDKFTQSVRRYF